MISNPELRRRGISYLEELFGDGAADALVHDMEGLCPDFTDMTIEWALGGIAARPGLDRISRELVALAACVTLGHATTQMRAHSQAALRAGATRQQIIEAILQLTFYAGGAAVRNALVQIKDILNDATLKSSGDAP